MDDFYIKLFIRIFFFFFRYLLRFSINSISNFLAPDLLVDVVKKGERVHRKHGRREHD